MLWWGLLSGPATSFLAEHLALTGQRPPGVPAICSDGIVAALEACRRAPDVLVSIHAEVADPDIVFIGQVRSVDPEGVELRAISPSAGWIDEPESWTWDEITRVDIGCRYEHALLRTATFRESGRDVLGDWPAMTLRSRGLTGDDEPPA